MGRGNPGSYIIDTGEVAVEDLSNLPSIGEVLAEKLEGIGARG